MQTDRQTDVWADREAGRLEVRHQGSQTDRCADGKTESWPDGKMERQTHFRAIGFFNEADTLESSSLLIYSESHTSLYTQRIG